MEHLKPKQMKLTAEIAYSYPNAHVTTKYDEGKSYKVVGVSEWEGNLQVQTSENDTDWWNIDQCQLILTPLSKISDEDAVEVAKIATSWDGASPLDALDVPEWLDEVMTGNSALTADYVSGVQVQELIDYLRSKGYDCGYSNLNSLIAAGVAVEKKEI